MDLKKRAVVDLSKKRSEFQLFNLNMGGSGNNTFVKYMLVCGLENSSGLEVDDTASSAPRNNRG